MQQENTEQQVGDQHQINKSHTFQPCFQENASWISKVLFLWTHQLIKRGHQKHLEMQDLSDLNQAQQPRFCAQKFQQIFYSLNPNQPGRLMTTFKKYFGFKFVLGGVLAMLANLLQFTGPIIIGKLLQYFNNYDQSNKSEGFILVTILILCYLVRTVVFQHGMRLVNICSLQVLSCANSLIYNKIMRLSSSTRKYLQAGAIMNNVSVDVMSFYSFVVMNGFLFTSPAMILVAIVMLIMEVGWIGLLTPIVFFFGMIAQQKLLNKGYQMRKDQLFWSDKRSKCVNEYFSGIRIIKYYGWEKMVADNIENIRTQQLGLNFRVLLIRTYVQVLMNMLPIISSIGIFGVYVAINGEDQLTTSKVYTVLAIFNLIATPMRLIAVTMVNYMNGQASLQRIEHFLGSEEMQQEVDQNKTQEGVERGEVRIINGKFNWQTEIAKNHHQQGKKLYSKKDKKKDKKQKTHKSKPKKKKKNKSKMKKEKDSVISQSNLSDTLLSSSNQKMQQKQEKLLKQSDKKYDLEIKQLKIAPGELVSVVGRVGSGKSTLLSTILGQISKLQGSVSKNGKIAYIPQVSWLRSATVRENILFEQPYNEQKYENVLRICELQPDLKLWTGEDLTQIGQKGLNLSGGQKQRISIARAVYSDADIYLIDDCLSALDPYVAKKIFNNVLKQHLQGQGKTIIFVTNAIEYAEKSDRIIVIDNGRIAEEGCPEQLQIDRNSLFNQLKVQYKKNKSQQQEKERQKQSEIKKKHSQDSIDNMENQQKEKEKKKKKNIIQGLVKVEQRLKGSVPWKFYIRFFSGPGTAKTLFIFSFIILAQFSRVASDWWLGQWGRKGFDIPETTYIWIYSVISIVVGCLLYLKGILFAEFILNTSKVIQRQLIKTLLKSPLSWFDMTPTGRILARTTKDQDDLDNSLSFNVQNTIQNIFVLIASIVLISIATPLYLIVAVISGFVYYKLVSMYINSSRQIKRLESNTRAPLISHFQQTISGMYVIRAFKKQDKFINKYLDKQKNVIVAMSNQYTTVRWISLMTDLFSVLTIAAAGYLGVASVVANIGPSASNFIGLALVWSLQISSIMAFTLRIMADTESNMNAVVRLYDYIDNNPAEKDFETPVPIKNPWPDRGVFSINKISYKYRPELPYVIKQVSFDVKQKSKIGIVGRTGSGKSTMTLGLLRILQIAANQDGSLGSIVLDGQNISQIGLHHLRHNVAIIPQDPVLFTGTVKTNIDPLDRYTDQDIADCLKKVQLWDQIKDNQQQAQQTRRKIYSQVDESGSNFSLGQRQLICMARALIRQPRVLLMDEATASIDEKTDETIQTMIRKQFTNTTVITIAHRLNTIIHYDKILVLNQGQVEEYDTPMNLISNQESFLGKTVRKVGGNYLSKIMSLLNKGSMEEKK